MIRALIRSRRNNDEKNRARGNGTGGVTSKATAGVTMSVPSMLSEVKMPSYVRDRQIGLISLMIAILFTGVFFTVYQLAGRAPSPHGLTAIATASGKVDVCGGLVASA